MEVSADVKYQHFSCNRLCHRLHMLLCPCWVSGGLSGEAQTRISGSSRPVEPGQWRLEFISAGPVLLCLAPQPNGLRELPHSPAPSASPRSLPHGGWQEPANEKRAWGVRWWGDCQARLVSVLEKWSEAANPCMHTHTYTHTETNPSTAHNPD